jgi:hypothetical protein
MYDWFPGVFPFIAFQLHLQFPLVEMTINTTVGDDSLYVVLPVVVFNLGLDLLRDMERTIDIIPKTFSMRLVSHFTY